SKYIFRLISIASSMLAMGQHFTGLQRERSLAVAEARDVVDPQLVEDAQHDIRQRRTGGCSKVPAAFEPAAGTAGQKEGDALVIVQVRVAHRRSVEQQRAIEQATVAVGRLPQ